MLERRFLCAEEIAVERQDRLGLVEFVVRLDPWAKSNFSRLCVDREVDRLVLVEINALGLQAGNQARTGRRAALLHQHVRLAVGQVVELLEHLGLGDDFQALVAFIILLGQLEIQPAIRVVQAQDRRLRVLVGSPVTTGKLGVTLHLDRPAVVRLGYQRNRAPAARHRRGKELRRAVHVVLRHLGERQNPVLRPTATAHPKARQRKRGGHDFHEVPARNRVVDQIHTRRKLLLDECAEFRRIGLVLKAAPVAWATLLLVCGS